MIRDPSGRVRASEACGFAGEHATLERYRKLELSAIPLRGPQATLTVPGTIGGWQIAAAMARENGGKLPLDMLLHHAISAAKDGAPVGRSEARYALKDDANLLAQPFFAETYFVDGKQPAAGARASSTGMASSKR